LLLGSLFFAALSLTALVSQSQGKSISVVDLLGTITSDGFYSKVASMLDPNNIVLIVAGFVGAFLVLQAVKSAIWLATHWADFGPMTLQRRSRFYAIGALILIGLLFEWASTEFYPFNRVHEPLLVVYFVLSAGSFVLLRTLLQSFVVDFFGDVQIYTTQDQNAAFYALRESILENVTSTIGNTMSAKNADATKRYDRVLILAHSLGSTIAMDSLIRLYTLKEQTKNTNADISDDFASIRAFVTFGTALEKTRYFFNVLRPPMSEAALQWENDQYGVMFTDDESVLLSGNDPSTGIFWTKLWYQQDPVCNEIRSYVSFLIPGDPVCDGSNIRANVAQIAKEGKVAVGRTIYNQRGWKTMALTPSRLCIHSLYLDDDRFWQSNASNKCGSPHIGILDIITSRASRPPSKTYAAVRALDAPQAPHPCRYRLMTSSSVADLRDRYG
jgi:hypothetical protein